MSSTVQFGMTLQALAELRETKAMMASSKDSFLTIWAWVINPLVPGWGTGPQKTRFPECLLLPYIGTCFSCVFWYQADF
jgi:hypothetical protein